MGQLRQATDIDKLIDGVKFSLSGFAHHFLPRPPRISALNGIEYTDVTNIYKTPYRELTFASDLELSAAKTRTMVQVHDFVAKAFRK